MPRLPWEAGYVKKRRGGAYAENVRGRLKGEGRKKVGGGGKRSMNLPS